MPDVLTDEELDALVSGDESVAHAGLIDHPMAAFVREACDLSAAVSAEPGPELVDLFQVRSTDPLPPTLIARRAPSPEPSPDTVGSPRTLRPAAPYRPSFLTRVLAAFQLSGPRPLAAMAGVTAVLVLIGGAVAGGLALRDGRVVGTGEVAIARQQPQTTLPGPTTVRPGEAERAQESPTDVPVESDRSGSADEPAAEASSAETGEPDGGSATAVVDSTALEVAESAPATTSTVAPAPAVSQTTGQRSQTTTLSNSGSATEQTTTTPKPIEETSSTTTATTTVTSTTIVLGDPETVVLDPGVAYKVPNGLGPGTYLAATSGDACRITIQRSGGGSVVITPSASAISFIVTQGDIVTTSVGCPTMFSAISGPISN